MSGDGGQARGLAAVRERLGEAGKSLLSLATGSRRTTTIAVVGALAAGAVAFIGWQAQRADALPPGFAKTNGRIEAERVDIATKLPGRLKDVLVAEGDTVQAGQIVARMDTAELDAQFRESKANYRQAEQQLDQAIALLAQRQSELTLADQELARSLELVGKGFTPQEKVDQRRSAKITAEAAVRTAQAQIESAKAAIEQAIAQTQRVQTQIDDSVLVAPRAGRIQYRLALPGEVLAAGGKVLTVLDLTDVYMTIFLPTKEAGRLGIGSEARIIFDAAPLYVVPATISFVAADAQFTPKYVETASEREKLMFRVKVQLAREVLEKYSEVVKTGVPGVAYVKVKRDAEWPPALAVRLPE
jgi:HlyD family secretion protein